MKRKPLLLGMVGSTLCIVVLLWAIWPRTATRPFLDNMALAGASTSQPERTDPWRQPVKMFLSTDERKKLDGIGRLRLGFVPDWYPLSFHIPTSNSLGGVAGDYAELLALTLGLQFEVVPADSPTELLRLAREGLVDLVALSDSRYAAGTGLAYSQPYLHLPEVFVIRQNQPPLLQPSEASGWRLVTAATPPTPTRLRKLAPGSSVTTVPGALMGMRQVQEGEADAYVGNLAVVGVLLRDRFLFDLKIGGASGAVSALGFAVSESQQWLLPIINRFLQAMPAEQGRDIVKSWLSVSYAHGEDWGFIVKKLLPWIGVGFFCTLLLLAAYLRVRSEVNWRCAAELRLLNVTRRLPAVVFQSGLDDGGKLYFTYVSANCVSIWGVSAASLLVEPGLLMERIAALDLPGFKRDMKHAAANVSELRMEFRVQGAGGIRWVRSCAMPHRCRAGNLVWSGYWLDVTDERQQVQRLLAAREAAECATREKSEFLALMARDIRAPLNGVLGMLDVMRRTTLSERQLALLDSVSGSAANLLRLVNDALDPAKTETGLLDIQVDCTDVRLLLDEVMFMFRPLADKRGIHLYTKVAPDLRLALQVDAVRLRQILMNLVSNAVKFTDEGQVSVEVGVVSTTETLQHLCFAVTDTGRGVDPDTLARLFQPFVQGRVQGGDVSLGGSGLGLAICRRLAEAMGGNIELSSVAGVGTQVVLNLPLAVDAVGSPLPALQHACVWVSLSNQKTEAALCAYLQALGVSPKVGRLGRPRCAPRGGGLIFSDGAESGLLHVQVIQENSERCSDEYQVSSSPLSWSVIRNLVCRDSENIEAQGQAQARRFWESPRRILLVDESRSKFKVTHHQLTELGYHCDVAEKGLQAMDFLGLQEYSLLVIDLHAENASGLALCRAISESLCHELRALPVLIIARTLTPCPESDLRHAGVARVLLKPLGIEVLHTELKQLFARVNSPDS